jgi:hypothetical protein
VFDRRKYHWFAATLSIALTCTFFLVGCQGEADKKKEKEAQAAKAAEEKQAKMNAAISEAQSSDCQSEQSREDYYEKLKEKKRSADRGDAGSDPLMRFMNSSDIEVGADKVHSILESCKVESKQRWLAVHTDAKNTGTTSVATDASNAAAAQAKAIEEKQAKNDAAISELQSRDCNSEQSQYDYYEGLSERRQAAEPLNELHRLELQKEAEENKYQARRFYGLLDACKRFSKQRWLTAHPDAQSPGTASKVDAASAAATAGQAKAQQEAAMAPAVSSSPAPTIVGSWKCLFLDSSVEKHYAMETYSETGRFGETMLFDQPDNKDFVKSVSGTYIANSSRVHIHFTRATRSGDTNLLQTSGDFESRITFLTEDQLNYVEIQGGRETNAENCERVK